jgi:subtilisin family serine protease
MNSVHHEYTITVPGTSKDVITVSANTADGNGMIYADGSNGPTLDGIVKPDIVAPGVAIAAAQAGTDRDAMPKGESGTSFSAPHVTGAIALALSSFRKSPPRDLQRIANQNFIRILLLDSARHFTLEGNFETGFGQLDAEAFFKAVRDAQ